MKSRKKRKDRGPSLNQVTAVNMEGKKENRDLQEEGKDPGGLMIQKKNNQGGKSLKRLEE